VELLSSGCRDSASCSTGHIRINGIDWLTTPPPSRGFYIVELAIKDCSVSNSRSFETYISTVDSDSMAAYVQSRTQSTVLIGITADEPTWHLTSGARDAMSAIGVDLSTLVYRGKAGFIAQIGRPSVSVKQVVPDDGSNMTMTIVVSRTY
jgi:Interleukin-like EMT inducer